MTDRGCKHGNPPGGDCPQCAAIVERAAKRIKANGGVSPRRQRMREQRLARGGAA